MGIDGAKQTEQEMMERMDQPAPPQEEGFVQPPREEDVV